MCVSLSNDFISQFQVSKFKNLLSKINFVHFVLYSTIFVTCAINRFSLLIIIYVCQNNRFSLFYIFAVS